MYDLKPFQDYLQSIQKNLATGDATEHTHRPALKILLENLEKGISATNEPKHSDCGAPDYIIRKGILTVGYIEAKDIGKSLDEAEKSDQLKRYFKPLSNLILTDYLEFRWYLDGEKKLTARLAIADAKGKLKSDKEGIQNVAELLTNFLMHKAVNVGKPKDLAVKMAQMAHLIRNLIINTFKKETEAGTLHSQLAAFRENLIPDLQPETFADMYAQTIAYGLFAARCTDNSGKEFTRQNAAYLLPKTNPFLRKLFNHIAGPDLDERIAWLVDDLAQLLNQADMAAVLEDFGKHKAKEDPVVHFYETFLKEYDPDVRETRGVYYTPEPVVSYIVRSIDYLLKTRFNKSQGLADPTVYILDPATGTATFLYTVIEEIHNAIIGQGQQGIWNNYVAEKLLPRLFGFELLMAPYAIAHLKLGLQLQQTGYKFETEERLGIYLTNTLEEAFHKAEKLGFAEYIIDEANAAAEIKKEKPIMVVLGNPPYSKASANKGVWIEKIMESYKTTVRTEETQIQALSDDYVKFIRFAEWRIEQTGNGIIGLITNHGYLNGPLFRDMRRKLLESFSEIFIIELHGDSRVGENTPDDTKDENVFDIQQGVAISLFLKGQGKTDNCHVNYAEIWGTREEKYELLLEKDINTTDWTQIKPEPKYYLFSPFSGNLKQEYDKYWVLTNLFGTGNPLKDAHIAYGAGFVTQQDKFAIGFTKDDLIRNLSVFLEQNRSEDELRDKFHFCTTNQWNYKKAQKELKDINIDTIIKLCLYRPFDYRYMVNNKNVTTILRTAIMNHLHKKNIALLSTRRVTSTPFDNFLVTNMIVEYKAVSYDRNTIVFPLYLYPSAQEVKSGLYKPEDRRPNLNPEFIKNISDKLGLKFIEDGKGDLKETFGPEDIFNYAYAVFHSPTYRTRYAEFLKIDFPRLPLTTDKGLFKILAEKGSELVALHLMESPLLNKPITKFEVGGTDTVEKVAYDEKPQRVYINKDQYFDGVPTEVWNFRIGGYQVCEKWLKDRKGRTLGYDDTTHYAKVVLALKETIRLMTEIDAAIPEWPIK